MNKHEVHLCCQRFDCNFDKMGQFFFLLLKLDFWGFSLLTTAVFDRASDASYISLALLDILGLFLVAYFNVLNIF